MNHPLAPLLQAFYTQPLTPEDRARIHHTLLGSLTDPAYQKSAVEYITHITTVPDSGPIDPYLLHHALHTIETLARTSFSSIPTSDLHALQNLLLDFLTTANLRHLSQNTPQSDRVPPHALNKAAAALVALSKRQWLANPSATDAFFPQVLFRLVDAPAHTPRSLASMLSGHALLTTLLDDALSPRRDLRAEDSDRLQSIIAAHAPRLLSALEVAQRAAGPNVPQHVAPAAARAVASLCRLSPTVASDACAILARSVHGRFDPISAHILSAANDILCLKANVGLCPIAESVIHALETLAAGTRSRKEEAQVSPALLSLVDILIQRILQTGDTAPEVARKQQDSPEENQKPLLEQVLNALMGVAVRWAAHRPSWFPRVLESWNNVFDLSFDCGYLKNELLVERVFPSVLGLCIQQAFFGTNRAVLGKLRQPSPAFFAHTFENVETVQMQDLTQWDKHAQLMSDLIQYPFSFNGDSLFLDNSEGNLRRRYLDGEDDDDEDFDVGDSNGNIGHNGTNEDGSGDSNLSDDDSTALGSASVTRYTACCIGVISTIAIYNKAEAHKAAEIAYKVLSEASDTSPGALLDVYNALTLAKNIARWIPSSDSLSLMQPICALTASGAWKVGRIGVIALRALAIHSLTLTETKGAHRQSAMNSASELVKVARQALAAAPPGHITTAAAYMIVCVYDNSRDFLFIDAPPFGIDEIIPISIGASSYELERSGYAIIATSILVNWIIVPPKDDHGLPIRWPADEWTKRQDKLAEISTALFSPLAEMAKSSTNLLAPNGMALRVITREAALLKTVILCLNSIYGRAVDAIWNACVREGVRCLITILNSLAQQVSMVDTMVVENVKQELTATVAGILAAIVKAAFTFNRCASVEKYSPGREAVQAVLGLANHPSLTGIAQQVMRLMRDRLAAGEAEMLETGIDMATRCLQTLNSSSDNGPDKNWKRILEDDVCEMSVSLLAEALKRHWLAMWPSDTVPSDTEKSVQSSDAGKAVYFKALGGIVEALKSRQLAVCRAALLALEQLNASRRLYSRVEAFRQAGAGVSIVTECLRILGGGGDSGRESLSDDAVEVLWGVVNADRDTFSRSLPEIIRQVSSGAIDEAGMQQVVKLFEGADDRSKFSRAALAAANDMVFYSSLRPAL